MSFELHLRDADLPSLVRESESCTESDVERALGKEHLQLVDLLALLSPAASRCLEPMAQRARALTLQRFGRTILLYAPIYVSNECTNRCAYCSFAVQNDVPRTTLTLEQAEAEAEFLRAEGFRHVLIVSGESRRAAPPESFAALIRRIRPWAANLTLEVYPLEEREYAMLVDAGADGVTLYQETYDRTVYAQVHPAGRKADYGYRLAALERAGRAGMARLNVGALLGLHPWRSEALAIALHASWLMKHFWRSQVAVSFPRLRHGPSGYQPAFPVSDRDLVQMMTAMRLFLPDAGIVLSTREPAHLRNALIPMGVTQMSAGSKTEPGGYTMPCEEGAQFSVEDRRSAAQIARLIVQAGYEPVWKDWDRGLSRGAAA